MQDIQLDTASAFYKSIAEKQVAILKTIPELQSETRLKKSPLISWPGGTGFTGVIPGVRQYF